MSTTPPGGDDPQTLGSGLSGNSLVVESLTGIKSNVPRPREPAIKERRENPFARSDGLYIFICGKLSI